MMAHSKKGVMDLITRSSQKSQAPGSARQMKLSPSVRIAMTSMVMKRVETINTLMTRTLINLSNRLRLKRTMLVKKRMKRRPTPRRSSTKKYKMASKSQAIKSRVRR